MEESIMLAIRLHLQEWLNNTVSILQQNSEWIKNLVTAICTIAGVIIAILTYKRAKASILQSEVAKQQTKKLNELLNLFNGFKQVFLQNIYYEIIICNLYEYGKLVGIGFHLSNSLSSNEDDEDLELDKLRDEWLVLDASTERCFSDIYEDMESKQTHKPANGFKKIDTIYITRSFNEFYRRMLNYADDPFLPKFANKIIKEILKEVDSNLRGPLAHAFDNNLDMLLFLIGLNKYGHKQSITNLITNVYII